MKLLLCDIGNTYSKILVINKRTKFFITKTSNFISLAKKYKGYKFFVSSVVPEILRKLKRHHIFVKVVTYKDLETKLPIKYDTKNLGSDRVLSAFVAKRIFGNNTLVVSCGTTIVLDYINNKGEYVGGAIFPGIGMLLKSLFLETSKLPLIDKQQVITSHKILVGKNTEECIVSGILNFCISGINYFVKNIKPKNIVVTGGDALVFKNRILYDANIYFIDNLVILSLLLLSFDLKMIENEDLGKLVENYFNEVLDIEKII
ncbi:MAG: type III pantothenate kinase [Endomicrobia bacterium]|nr:type III pantothenate kinase [Endomicrobiia bacterium]MDW8055448.1 type III pantothenate kinase [Elusimicrobiota bacterium]